MTLISRVSRATSPFARLLSIPRADSNFIHLADQLGQAVLLASRRTGAIEHVNHAAVALTGYSRTELERLTLSDLFPARGSIHPMGALVGIDPDLPCTLFDVAMATHREREASADLHISFIGPSPDSSVLILAEDAAPRLKAKQSAHQAQRSLEALESLIGLCVSPDEAAITRAVELARVTLGAAGSGLYLVKADEPGMHLVAGVELDRAFPIHLPANEVERLLSPEVWTSGQRAEHALSQAARFAGWDQMFIHPIGEAAGQLGLFLVGYRPEESRPARSLMGVASQQLYLILRQIAQQEGMQELSANHLAVSSKLQSLLNQIRDSVILIGANGRVQDVNPSASRLLRYEPEEAIGMSFEDLLISPQGLTAGILTTMNGGGPTSASQITLHNRMGESIPAAVRVAPLGGEDGQSPLAGAMVLIADQSERVAFEQRSQQLEQQALLGELSAILAHEVRNPISNISAIAQLMAGRLPADSPLQEKLVNIQAETRRLVRLMDDVLDYSRPLRIEIAPQSLGKVVERVLDRWAPRFARAKVSVRRELLPAPPALIDTRSIEQALTNLVDNALHAMPNGGTLSVILRPLDRDPRGPLVELVVADTGQGIDEETRARIFDPFFTTRGNGTGLGLSITRHILITVHKGSISVESFPGTGSIFTITLPAVLGSDNHASFAA